MKESSLRPAWQLPMQWPSARPGTPDAPWTVADRDYLRKSAIVFTLVALTALDRFGLHVTPDYSIPAELMAMYALAAATLLSGRGELNPHSALAYLALVCVAATSHFVNLGFEARQYISTPSLLLLLASYAPFVISPRRDGSAPQLGPWALERYVEFMLFVAAAGMAQHFVQFVYQPPWLFDFRPMIPEALRGSGGWNTVYTVGGWTKANGFFLREPSMFSTAMAFGLLAEMSLGKRKWAMAVLAFALILSYSGSGLLALSIAMLFPLGRGTALRLLVCAVLVGVAVLLLGDLLNLSYTLNRVGEITSERSSAYCRFVYPGLMTGQLLDSTYWSLLLGHGPGSMERMGATCEDLHSVAYAKSIFEYGVLGAAAFAALVFGALARSGTPLRMRIAAAVTFALLGGLYNAEILALIYLLYAAWPREGA